MLPCLYLKCHKIKIKSIVLNSTLSKFDPTEDRRNSHIIFHRTNPRDGIAWVVRIDNLDSMWSGYHNATSIENKFLQYIWQYLNGTAIDRQGTI